MLLILTEQAYLANQQQDKSFWNTENKGFPPEYSTTRGAILEYYHFWVIFFYEIKINFEETSSLKLIWMKVIFKQNIFKILIFENV